MSHTVHTNTYMYKKQVDGKNQQIIQVKLHFDAETTPWMQLIFLSKGLE